MAIHSARAGTVTFDGGVDGTGTILDTAANWVGDSLPVTTDEAVLDNSVISLPSALTLSTAQTFGDLVINSSTLTSVSLTGTTNRNITLSGGGGSAAAIAAGGASGDLLVLGNNVTGLVSVGGGSGTGKLGITLGTSGNFNVVNSSAQLSVTGAVIGGFDLVKTGAGYLQLTSSNTLSNLVIKGGTVGVNSSSFTAGTGASIILGDGAGGNATFAIGNSSGSSVSVANNIIAQAGSGTLTLSATSIPNNSSSLGQNTTFSGNITLNNNLTFNMNRSSRSMTVSGLITGGSTINITGVNATSVVILTNAGNATSFTGNTTITSGALRFSSGALGDAGTITFLGNGTLQWNTGNTQDISSKTITVGSGITGTLDTNGNDVVLATTNGLTGAGNFIKAGTGTLTLSAANNYTGTTTISAGTLQIGNGGTTGSVAGAIVNNASLTVNRSNAYNLSNSISGTGAFTQAGAGTTTLAGANTYTGTTTVSAGTLLVNGNMSGATGAVTVAAGATLGGSGTVGGATTVSGNLSAGNSPGTLTFSRSLTLAASAESIFEINGLTEGLQFDSVVVGTSLTYGGTLTLDFGYGATVGTQYDLFDFGTQSGTFSAINFLDAGYEGDFDYSTGILTLTAVPEPSTYVLLAGGLAALALLRRRKKS